jgi:two-component system NtrC family response regulator
MANILIIDDEPKMGYLVEKSLTDEGFSAMAVSDPSEGLRLISERSFDIVVTDLSMPEISGLEVLEAARKKGDVDVVIMTAYGAVETAVEAMKKGAADYILKPFSMDILIALCRKLADRQKLEALSGMLSRDIRQISYDKFIGDSPAAKTLLNLISKVAPTDTTVLLTGKSGTGKELAANLIHENSRRHNKPFIAVNCAALTETLLESELFGHEKGSFTGAVARKRGRFELADGGTIFLDEIGEMSPSLQAKLLRVLEEKQFVRVGGVDPVKTDVRVIAATNRNLKEEIAKGGFREDLYFRLNVFPIEMPSLARRREDIGQLAGYFLEKQGYTHPALSGEVIAMLSNYSWPGNIRELKNILERAMILAGGEPIEPEHIGLEDETETAPLEMNGEPGAAGLESAEKQMILDALKNAGGNKTEAAKLLKITRRRLYSRMKYHDIK